MRRRLTANFTEIGMLAAEGKEIAMAAEPLRDGLELVIFLGQDFLAKLLNILLELVHVFGRHFPTCLGAGSQGEDGCEDAAIRMLSLQQQLINAHRDVSAHIFYIDRIATSFVIDDF